MKRTCLTCPSGGTGRELRGSCIDIACRPLVINQFWMYEGHMDTDRIKDSLTGILEMYPSLAGRMSGDRIICNGAGVLFEYSSFPETSSRDISRMEIPGERYGATFDVKAAMAGKSSLMSVKVSRLKDGTLLNVKCSHFCADGDAFYTMVRNWASETRGETAVRRPIYDQDALPGILAVSPLYSELAAMPKESVSALLQREGFFRIRASLMLQMLRQKILRTDSRLSAPMHVPQERIDCIQEQSMKECGTRAGSNAVLSAIAAGMVKKLMRTDNEAVSLVHTADHRGRIPGIGPGYMGNASFTLRPTSLPPGLSEGQAAALTDRDMKRQLEPGNEAGYFALYCAMLEKKVQCLPFDINAMWSRHPSTFIINNCLKFNIYDMDFGSGRPVFAWPLDFGDPVRFWPAPPGEDGAYIYFTGQFAAVMDWHRR